jgi:hypothetical protein
LKSLLWVLFNGNWGLFNRFWISNTELWIALWRQQVKNLNMTNFMIDRLDTVTENKYNQSFRGKTNSKKNFDMSFWSGHLPLPHSNLFYELLLELLCWRPNWSYYASTKPRRESLQSTVARVLRVTEYVHKKSIILIIYSSWNLLLIFRKHFGNNRKVDFPV